MKKLEYSPEALSKLKSIKAEITGKYGADLANKIMIKMVESIRNLHIYKDICNPITAEFREELYGYILEAYEKMISQDKEQQKAGEKAESEMPEFSVTVTPYEREGSNVKGLARIYFEDSFIVNNISILQGKENVFVAMPSYKTKQTDEQGKAIYQDVCYPVTKEFREKLYNQIIDAYEQEKKKQQEQTKKTEQEKDKELAQSQGQFQAVAKQETPFR